jgi:hypothetical protein
MVIVLKVLNPIKSIETLITIGIGAIVYFTCLFLIDFEVRTIFKKLFVYIKRNHNLWK